MRVSREVKEYLRKISLLGASKGGKRRAEKLTAEQRQAISRKGAEARWKGKRAS